MENNILLVRREGVFPPTRNLFTSVCERGHGARGVGLSLFLFGREGGCTFCLFLSQLYPWQVGQVGHYFCPGKPLGRVHPQKAQKLEQIESNQAGIRGVAPGVLDIFWSTLYVLAGLCFACLLARALLYLFLYL